MSEREGPYPLPSVEQPLPTTEAGTMTRNEADVWPADVPVGTFSILPHGVRDYPGCTASILFVLSQPAALRRASWSNIRCQAARRCAERLGMGWKRRAPNHYAVDQLHCGERRQANWRLWLARLHHERDYPMTDSPPSPAPPMPVRGKCTEVEYIAGGTAR